MELLCLARLRGEKESNITLIPARVWEEGRGGGGGGGSWGKYGQSPLCMTPYGLIFICAQMVMFAAHSLS